MRKWSTQAVVAGALLLLGSAPVPAAEITILAGMGNVSGLRDLAPAFEKTTGNKVIVSFEQGPAMNRKINSGAPTDVAALQPDQLDAFIKDGKIVPGTHTNFSQAGVGVAVKAGAARPDISTLKAFRVAMLQATSIGYSRGGSGLIAAKVMEKLGIAGELKPRTKFIDGTPVAEAVAKGDVEVGLQQINVILPVAGADYVGPLPGDLQQTVKFAAGVLAVSKEPEAAKAFLKFIASPEAGPLLRKSGMEPWTD